MSEVFSNKNPATSATCSLATLLTDHAEKLQLKLESSIEQHIVSIEKNVSVIELNFQVLIHGRK